jgi:hypothetical protein
MQARARLVSQPPTPTGRASPDHKIRVRPLGARVDMSNAKIHNRSASHAMRNRAVKSNNIVALALEPQTYLTCCAFGCAPLMHPLCFKIRHRFLARRRIPAICSALRRASSYRPEPAAIVRCRVSPHDPPDVPLAIEHVVIIIRPLAAWPPFECAFQNKHESDYCSLRQKTHGYLICANASGLG